MRVRNLILLAGSVAAGAATAQFAPPPPPSIPIEGIAARVNDRVVLVSDVIARVRPIEERLRTTLDSDELQEALGDAYDSALEDLIAQGLMLEEFEAMEAEIPEKAVDEQLATITAERFGNDRAELLKALQAEQVSLEEWRQQVKDQLIVGVMRRQSVFDKVSLSPQAPREAYEQRIEEYTTPEQIKLRMIMISKGTTPEELVTSQERVQDATARLEAGEAFEAVARDLSEGSKADDGGDYGWMPLSDLRPELAKVAAQQEIGQVGRLVSVDGIYYLMRIEDRREASRVPFDEVREDIKSELRRNEAKRIESEWLDRLREKHFVKIY